MRQRIVCIAAVVLIVCALLAGCTSTDLDKTIDLIESVVEQGTATEAQAVPEPTLAGPYAVVRVVDGDTLIADIDGAETRIRLIGIDTPESVHSDSSRNTQEGKEASDWTKTLLDGQTIYLEYDVDHYDDYDRLLAYVYLSDGITMVERELLRNGLAVTMTIQPNSKYSNEFYALQIEAREAGVGFWATGFFP